MEMIEKIDYENALLDEKFAIEIAKYDMQIKQLNEEYDIFKRKLLEEMKDKGIITAKANLENGTTITISYVGNSTRETLDSKKIKEEHPEIFNEYSKISVVKESVRISVK